MKDSFEHYARTGGAGNSEDEGEAKSSLDV